MKNTLLWGVCLLFIIGLMNMVFAIELPSEKAQNEIRYQIMELAVANFDSKFTNQYRKLLNSKENDSEAYRKELLKSYFMIKHFRELDKNFAWANKQDLKIATTTVRISKEDVEQYEQDATTDVLLRKLISLRPNVPMYSLYRKNIIKYLSTKDAFENKYDFQVIKEGVSGENVNSLKRELIRLGYLSDDELLDGRFTNSLKQAVIQYQIKNGMSGDGIVGRFTYDFMFMSNMEKAVRLARSIIRIDDSSMLTSNKYVLVNIPDMQLHVYENGVTVLDSTVVVGRKDRQTPRLASKINNVVFNPAWTVPKTIANKDYFPKLLKDRNYLERKGLKLFTYNGEPVDPTELTDDDLNNAYYRYKIVQAPGLDNALGIFKFNFPNKDDVYLHSTSAPKYFKKEVRTLSSGCVRVEKSYDLALYLLKDTYFSKGVIDKIIKEGRTKWAPINDRVPVYIAYWTAYIAQDSKIYFKPDVYAIDSGKYNLPEWMLSQ